MVGIASRMVAQIYRRKKLVDMETAFSAGLLHDIGKIILEQFFQRRLPSRAESGQGKRHPPVTAEKNMLGMSHADVSGMLVDKWQMPNELKAPIVNHHSPMEEKSPRTWPASCTTPTISAISRQRVHGQ